MVPPPPPGLREVPEQELVQRFRVGGREGDEAYSELVARHQQWIVRLVGFLAGSFRDAEDIAQEAFVRGYTHRESFGGDANFRAWLRVIATRLAYNYRRDAATRQKYHEQARSSESLPPTAATEARDLLDKTLRQLPYVYREILILRYVEELPVKEIAGLLNLGESAAKMRLVRARDEFQQLQQRQ